MRKIILSAGHTNIPGKDRGAMSGNFIEGNLAADFVSSFGPKLIAAGLEVYIDPFKNALADTLANLKNKTTKTDIAIEIHWNAAGPTATGTETLIPGYLGLRTPTEFEKKAGAKLSATIARVLNIRNRGVKMESESARGRLGWMGVPCENLLIEMCFISNPNDMKSYEENKDKLEDELLKDLVELVKL